MRSYIHQIHFHKRARDAQSSASSSSALEITHSTRLCEINIIPYYRIWNTPDQNAYVAYVQSHAIVLLRCRSVSVSTLHQNARQLALLLIIWLRWCLYLCRLVLHMYSVCVDVTCISRAALCSSRDLWCGGNVFVYCVQPCNYDDNVYDIIFTGASSSYG